MAKYELMLILKSQVTEEDRTKTLGNLKKIFSENNVTIENENILGEKKLAYKINSSKTGVYVLYTLELDWKTISSMTKTMNLDSNLVRFMFVKLDK